MLRLFADTAALALRRAAKAWPVAFSLVIYGALMIGAAMLLQPMGMVGGFIIGLVAAACLSSYLHLLAQAVSGSKVTLGDLKQGFRARFWDVISVMFAMWILSIAIDIVSRGAGENAPAIVAMATLAMAFFFNPVPELLYLGRTRSFALLAESARFMFAHPVAWLLPNLIFATVILAPTGGLHVGRPAELLLVFSAVFSATGVAGALGGLPLWAMPLALLLFHYVMVFRGVLFTELGSSNPRLRAFRAGLGGR